MIIKILAALGIVFILFCVWTAFAVLSPGIHDDYYSDPEEDEEQAKYIREWIKKNER